MNKTLILVVEDDTPVHNLIKPHWGQTPLLLKPLWYLKYIILVVFVILLPMFATNSIGIQSVIDADSAK